jgi:hypothetical protein
MTPLRLLAPLLLACAVGCTAKTGPTTVTPTEKAVKTDPWPAAAAILRRQPDLGGARQAISLLNSELGESTEAEKPKPMPADAAKALGERLRLTPDELKDAAGTQYTNLDAAYLTECLIVRDAIRSLDFGNLPIERKLRLAFDWVCRQIYLRQGIIHTPQGPAFSPPLPPQFALYRGYGSGLDRAYLFLAVIQQLGLDGCLIGPPDREIAPGIALEDNKPTKGPFWAVGCRLPNGSVALFDPWRGEAFPGTNGAAGTLTELVANPDLLKPWIDDKARPWDGKLADVKAASIYVALPYLAASDRMKLLETKIGGEVGVKLARDPAELAERFGANAKVWSATTDQFCLTRALPSFLPLEEGGTDTSSTRELRLHDQILKLAPIPLELFAPPADVTNPEVRNALKAFFLKRFSDLVVESNPRERIGRGQFNDVIRTLVERERQIGQSRERAQRNPATEEALKEWAETANDLYEKQSIARLPRNQANLPAAQAAVEQFWERGGSVIQLIEDRYILPICAVELGYLLAICKHEQAERASIRLMRAGATETDRAAALSAAKDAWLVAKDAWDRHFAASEALAKTDPSRTVHTRRLAARAARLAADPNPKN